VLPVTVTDSTGAEVTINSIERIVPVDGDLAEVVFALGLGDNVVAVDISATYPIDVDALPDIGYQRALNAESVAAVEPTVVLATDLAQPPEVLEQLRKLRIPVVVIEREFSLSGPSNKVRRVADALGVPGRGEALAASMQADIDAAVDDAAGRSAEADPLRIMVVYVRGPSTQLIFGEGTGADVLIEAVGGIDVASDIGVIDNAPITAESLLNAQPDVLVVTTTGLASVGGIDGLLAIGGIARTPAGEQRRILAFEDQFLLGGGPRFAALIASLVDQLYPIEP
jgi:iron complex transport system substrate-binding protein